MREWNQTEIAWPMWNYHAGYEEPKDGRPTTIPFFDSAAKENGICSCTSITVTSTENGGARFEVLLRGRESGNPPSSPSWSRARDRLKDLEWTDDDEAEFPCRLRFTLRVPRNCQFCDFAVETVGLLFERFGIEDLKRDIRGNFKITRTTYLFLKGKKMTFEDALRMKHGLKEPYIFYWTN